jgi:hypothetical protein
MARELDVEVRVGVVSDADAEGPLPPALVAVT